MGYCEPAFSLVKKFETHIDKRGSDGVRALSDGTGIPVKTIYRFMWPESKGGLGGFIPRKYHLRIKEFGKQAGIEITNKDLFPLDE